MGFLASRFGVRGYLDLDTIFGEEENVKVLQVRNLVLQVVASDNMTIKVD